MTQQKQQQQQLTLICFVVKWLNKFKNIIDFSTTPATTTTTTKIFIIFLLTIQINWLNCSK